MGGKFQPQALFLSQFLTFVNKKGVRNLENLCYPVATGMQLDNPEMNTHALLSVENNSRLQ